MSKLNYVPLSIFQTHLSSIFWAETSSMLWPVGPSWRGRSSSSMWRFLINCQFDFQFLLFNRLHHFIHTIVTCYLFFHPAFILFHLWWDFHTFFLLSKLRFNGLVRFDSVFCLCVCLHLVAIPPLFRTLVSTWRSSERCHPGWPSRWMLSLQISQIL